MDISSLQQNESTVLNILHPTTNVPTDITVNLLSRDSEAIQALVRKQMNVRLKKAAEASRMGNQAKTTAEEIDAESTNLLVAAVTGWKGMEMDGETLPCTPENVGKVLTNPSFRWFKKQIDVAFGDTTRFFES